ncbi:MAG TPA: T9SS type A sorting domain-containing protein [Bacteroidia bacterium]|nr:T9SS type A sorting domain-containing protein [Bacteroidia bacterium]
MKKITTSFLLSLPFLGLAQTATTVANGNWTSASIWSVNTTPSTNNASITVANTVTVNTSIGLSGTTSLLVTGSLIDPTGGSAYSLNLSNFSNLTVSGNVTFEGNLSVSNSATITITSGATLTVKDVTFSNNTILVINTGGSFVVKGDLHLSNNNAIVDNGSILVSGDLQATNNVTLSGTGSAAVAGSSSTSNGATVFGGQGNCTNCSFTSSTPLPIELLYFNAKSATTEVNLSWGTITETNNNYFTIEKSKDGINFDVLRDLKTEAKNGNSTTALNYKMVDEKPYEGISYYRLKQTDFNGKYKYYDMKQVNVSAKTFVSVYPNPAVSDVLINTSEDYAGADVKIMDALGREVISEKISATNLTTINTTTLLSGVYYVLISNEGAGLSKTKIMVQH